MKHDEKKNDGLYEEVNLKDDDDEFIDEEELDGLVVSTTTKRRRAPSSDSRKFACAIAAISLIVIIMMIIHFNTNKTIIIQGDNDDSFLVVNYSCPSTILPADNYNEIIFKKHYDRVSEEIDTSDNMTEFLATFRKTKYDAWGKTYNRMKHGLRDFKQSFFAPYLQHDGMSIYESACGIGLNLFMTLEILYETNGVQNLIVYGNEYEEISAVKANAIFDIAAPANATKGNICHGDSNHLDFVPSNSFDLVFTGYISSLLDPLEVGTGNVNEDYEVYSRLCKQQQDWKSKKLVQLAQQKQRDWYGHWISEMIRIAKPGVPVIIESVAPPYCRKRTDWGGVARTWWKQAVETYAWDVDPNSIHMEDDTIFEQRYHVFMMKNKSE